MVNGAGAMRANLDLGAVRDRRELLITVPAEDQGRVLARAALVDVAVVARVPDEGVAAVLAGDLVVGVATGERVVVGATEQRVDTTLAEQRVGTRLPHEDVVALNRR